MSKRKVLLVGWDAADWKIMNPLMDRGWMPATRQLVENGVMANIATLSPVFSPMLWTSIATGKRPYKHGILGFSEPTPDRRAIRPVTNLSRRTKAIWNILGQEGLKSNVVGWWPSHPAEPIRGVMVSNQYQRAPSNPEAPWPMPPGTVHPDRVAEPLAELRFHPSELEADHLRPFLPDGHKIDQSKDRRVSTVMKILADCTSIQSAATWLMENEPWDFMAVYFDAIDHFSHGFMRYHPPRLPWVKEEDFELYQHVVSAGYVYHDMMLARLLELAGPETTVILMSDHGFHPDHLRRRELPNEPAGPATEHREHGIFVAAGPGLRKDELIHGVSLLDITPTILTLFGLPVGQDMDGRVLTEIFETPVEPEAIESWDQVAGDSGQHPPDKHLDVRESAEGIAQLVALGYIEPPDENIEQAVADTERELKYNLAISLIDGGRHGEAIPLLHELYLAYPLEFRFAIRLAICLQAMGRVDDLDRLIDNLNQRWRRATNAARERLSEVREIAQERKRERKQMIEGGRLPETDQNTKPLDLLFNPQELKVIRKLRSMARGNPATLDYLAGWVAMSRGEFAQAIDLLQKAESSQSRFPGFHVQMGEAYRQMEEHKKAHECYQRAIDIDPHDPFAYLGWARSYLTLKKNVEALEMARKALSLKFHSPVAHFCLGVCQMRNEQFEDAVRSFLTAVELNPNFAEAYERLAQIYRNALHDADQAREYEHLADQIGGSANEAEVDAVPLEWPEPEAIDYHDVLPRFKPTLKQQRHAALGDGPLASDSLNELRADKPPVIVVSGLPRSGTSAMMQMLRAAGIEPLSDDVRQADDNNPKGYFELERVKSLPRDNKWLDLAHGKAIKVVTPLVPFLPQDQNYRVIVMDRSLDEIIESQTSMLNRLEKSASENRDQIRRFLEQQQQTAIERLKVHDIPHLVVEHRQLIQNPEVVAEMVAKFLDLDADTQTMSQVIDPSLHRERV